jgi:hypothetical protein
MTKRQPTVSSAVRYVMMATAVHLAVVAVHGVAHLALGVLPESAADWIFIGAFIYVAPMAVIGLGRAGRGRVAAALCLVGLSGSLAYGFHHHFVAVSIDHIDHLPAGGAWAQVFRATALGQALIDLAGAAVAAWALARGGIGRTSA